LDCEIDLAGQRRRVLRLHHVVLEQKGHVVEQFDRGLAVNANDGAVDEEPFSCSKRNVHANLT
jgi:hypothetical protein